ncbi:DUF2274 domain-containing protein [Thiomonas sp.]
MLKKVTSSDPIVRLSLGFHQSTADLLAAYRQAYQETHGDEISQSLLIETLVREYILADRDFQRRSRAPVPRGSAPTKPLDTSF